MNKSKEKWEEKFESRFIYKGEDGDDPVEKHVWTIAGSFPYEVKSFIAFQREEARREVVEEIRERIEKYRDTLEGSDDYTSGKYRALDEVEALLSPHQKGGLTDK